MSRDYQCPACGDAVRVPSNADSVCCECGAQLEVVRDADYRVWWDDLTKLVLQTTAPPGAQPKEKEPKP
jgi:hypothetical protein